MTMGFGSSRGEACAGQKQRSGRVWQGLVKVGRDGVETHSEGEARAERGWAGDDT